MQLFVSFVKLDLVPFSSQFPSLIFLCSFLCSCICCGSAAYVTCHSNLIKVYVPKGSLDNSSFQASRKLCAETGGYLPPASFDTCITSLLEKVYPAEQNRASWRGDEHLFKVNSTVVGLDNVLATCVKPGMNTALLCAHVFNICPDHSAEERLVWFSGRCGVCVCVCVCARVCM